MISQLSWWGLVQLGSLVAFTFAVRADHVWIGAAVLVMMLCRKMPKW